MASSFDYFEKKFPALAKSFTPQKEYEELNDDAA